MAIRIKAREDFQAQFALSMVGGKRKGNRFEFKHEGQRQDYERILKRLEAENKNDLSESGHIEINKAAKRHYQSRVRGGFN